MMDNTARVIRFTKRKLRGDGGRRIDFIHFYLSPREGKVFQGRCDRDMIESILRDIDINFEYSRGKKVIYLKDSAGDDIFRRFIILTGLIQCTKSNGYWHVFNKVDRLSVYETLFWYTFFIKEFELEGYRGVCRVARSFKILYQI